MNFMVIQPYLVLAKENCRLRIGGAVLTNNKKTLII